MSEQYHEEISQWFVCELNSDHKRVYSGLSGNAHLERAQKDGWYNHVTGCTWRSLCPDCVQECRVSLASKGYLPVVIPMRYGALFTKGLTEFIEGSIAPRGFAQQWISVADRLPEHDGEYLVTLIYDDGTKREHEIDVLFYNPNEGGIGYDHGWNFGEGYFAGIAAKHSTVTHWQPLPSLPEEVSE